MFDPSMYRIRNEMERMLEHGLVIPVEKKSLPTKNKTDKPDPFKLYFKYGSKILKEFASHLFQIPNFRTLNKLIIIWKTLK